MQQHIIGWDVGGAHLKAALLAPTGEILWVAQYPCPLWQGLQHLQKAIAAVAEAVPHCLQARHIVTMTGELVDLFPDRHQGVLSLIQELQSALAHAEIYFFAGVNALVLPEAALYLTDKIASANWLATAYYLAQATSEGLLIDMGSTTTDLLILQGQRVAYRGYSDAERLQQGELVYTGMIRTAVMSLATRVPFAGQWQPLMSEYFATTADVYRLLKKLPEYADQLPSADGQEKTLFGSSRRLARMLGRDVHDAPLEHWQAVAQYLADCQQQQIQAAIALQFSRGLLSSDAPLIGAGIGRGLVRSWAKTLKRPYREFGDFIRVKADYQQLASDCAPAVAVAYLGGIK